MKLVLDTDIGGDFDDANALALLLAAPEPDLVAVTTVGAGASAHRRAQVAKAMLMDAGRGDVPVHAGADSPAVRNEVLDSLSPEHCLNAWEKGLAGMTVEQADAADAVITLAQRHGADLVLLCIGALTNVAEAIRRNPQAMARVGEIVAMSGAFHTQHREANAAIDPEAADTVYRSGIPLRLVGFEEAARARLDLDAYRAAATASPVAAMLAKLAAVYAEAYRTTEVTLCDVTAVAAVLHPEWFTFQSAKVAVELNGSVTRGMTIAEADPFFNRVPSGSAVSIAADGRPDLVLDLFRTRVLTAGPAREEGAT
ncbi:nucleoside hydrolase [Lysobacter korlensis]|uniref:Nucleoside hydrolase n=1 Tax=Lysobacter korlensis TaxID=553636 RepID=A0ABV6RU28_9GAMM